MRPFYHNPPGKPDLIKSLFVGRRNELMKLNRCIPDGFSGSTVYAVHGMSRVGKSHLALHYFQQLENQAEAGKLNYNIFRIKADGRLTAYEMLKDLYSVVRNKIQLVEKPEAVADDELGTHGILEQALDLIRIFDSLISSTETQREVTFSRTFEESPLGKIAFKITIPLPIGPSVELGYSEQKNEKQHGTKALMQRPNDYQLADIIAELADALFQTTNNKNIIYVDDIDLLDAGPLISQEQVAVLIPLLNRIAENESTVVVASLRTRNLTTTGKRLTEALHVKPLTEAEMLEVYKKHIHHFNDGQPIFDDDCLKALSKQSHGLVGNFLGICERLYNWGYNEKDPENPDVSLVLTLSHLQQFLLEQLNEMMRDPELRVHIQAIREAIRKRQQEVSLDSSVLGTPLMNLLLEEPLTHAVGPRLYRINGVAARALRDAEDANSSEEK